MKRLLFTATAAAILAAAAPSLAQEGGGWEPIRKTEKPPSVAIDFRFGTYRPQVDRAFTNAQPYQDVFGDDTRFMVGGEVDWQFLHIRRIGSLAVGGLFGYTRATAKARFTGEEELSEETTAFDLWLLSVVGVFKVDVLARETWIPIVPYVKVGPAIGLWSSSNGLGISRAADGTIARGRTNGFFYAFGGMFLLDVLDRQTAKTFAAEQGVKHTYFFAEYTIADVRGTAQKGAMQVGDTTWTIGISFEL